MQNKTILITGATSGFGQACARAFAAAGNRVIITGRRAERLMAEQQLLQNRYGAESYPLVFDVRDKNEVKKAIASLPPEWQNIDILLNNAGLAAGSDLFADASTDDWETMIDTNIKGLLFVTKSVLPLLLTSKCPHIVNIGSIAGKEVYAKGNVYCATKFAVDAITRALRIDLLDKGVKVTQVAPGAAETEFSLVRFKGDTGAAAGVYKGFEPLKAEDIAGAVLWVTGLPPHVNINDMVIMPTAQASPGYFHKV